MTRLTLTDREREQLAEQRRRQGLPVSVADGAVLVSAAAVLAPGLAPNGPTE